MEKITTIAAVAFALSCPVAAQVECAPQFNGQVYHYTLPFAVTGMWTQVSADPGTCGGGPCKFKSHVHIEIASPAAPGPALVATLFSSSGAASGAFPLPQDPALPGFTQVGDGDLVWELKCGESAKFTLEMYVNFTVGFLTVVEINMACLVDC